MNAISIKDVEKKFKVYYDKGYSLKERLLFRNRNRYEERQVLKGISFDIKKGESVGIIGENGSGKSTLLKLMSRIIYPDKGTIEINGRVSSLIELGAGFHPDMSGRENIYTNASIFGLKRKEIDDRLDEIIAFSELEEFIDNPVRTYSSGMYMRLAFSVAINVDADVLLIDEILAVGDVRFQSKCFNKLREIKRKGTTIVIVSHSLGQIEQICDKSIWLHQGAIKKYGSPRDVHPEYMEFMSKKKQKSETEYDTTIAIESVVTETQEQGSIERQEYANINRWGNKYVEIIDVTIKDKDGKEIYEFKTGDEMNINIEYRVNTPVKNPVIGIGIFRNDGIHCYGTNTNAEYIRDINLREKGKIVFNIIKNNLLDGEYLLDVAIHDEDGFAYDYIKGVKSFHVHNTMQDIGVIRLEHKWLIE